MSRSIRINTAQKIYFNNTEVDDVYYNNEHIWPPTPFFVSNDGTDDVSVSGDINNPFQTLAFARSQITNQDTIYFRTGSYEFDEEEITNAGLSIRAYNYENVTFDGTRPISDLADSSVNGGQWSTHTTNIITDTNQTLSNKTIYKIKLNSNVEIWQLFHNRDEVINARYPSAQWSDETVYNFNNWGHGYYEYKGNGNITNISGSVLGNGTGSHYYYENGEIVDVAHIFSGSFSASLYDFVTAQQGLGNGFNVTGSMINLNIGSFRTYTKLVTSQSLDSTNDVIRLSYHPVSSFKTKHHYYYLENKIEYLNSENEWFFDNTTKYLYVWLKDDAVPSTTNIRAKQQSYSLNVTARDVSIENINFFSTTIKGNNANHLKVRDCNFQYASCYAHMLNQINSGSTISPADNETFETQTRITSSPNVSFNGCAFRYTDGDVIHTQGGDTTIIDCYFNFIDKTVANLSSVMTTLRLMGNNNLVSHNTIHKTAASSTLNSGNRPIVEYNDLSDTGHLQSDGAMIHLMAEQQNNAKIRYNWVHDTIKYGIRFDGDGEGNNGYIHHNVGWNCVGGIMAKGGILDGGVSVGGHFVYNNTMFNSVDKNDIMVLNVQAGNDINFGSVVMNNLAESISGHRTNAEAFEARITSSNNYTQANIEPLLTDSASFDFRPINTASIVDAANTTYTNFEFNPTGSDAFTSDIGALQHGGNIFDTGITWNTSGNSDSQFVTDNRFNFLYTTSVAWSPSTDITTALWLDASDTTSYTLSGATLNTVTDKSGNFTVSVNNTPTRVSADLNSLDVWDFDGTESLITNSGPWASSGNHWAIGVFEWHVVDSNKDSFWSADGTRTYALSSSDPSSWDGEIDYDGSNSISTGLAKNDFTVSISSNTWTIISIVFNKTGNQIFGRLNGTTRTSVDPYSLSMDTNATDVRMMRNRSGQKTNGRMAEYFHVAGVPGSGGTNIDDVKKAEGYLAHKWGLEGNLPADHPYKTSAP